MEGAGAGAEAGEVFDGGNLRQGGDPQLHHPGGEGGRLLDRRLQCQQGVTPAPLPSSSRWWRHTLLLPKTAICSASQTLARTLWLTPWNSGRGASSSAGCSCSCSCLKSCYSPLPVPVSTPAPASAPTPAPVFPRWWRKNSLPLPSPSTSSAAEGRRRWRGNPSSLRLTPRLVDSRLVAFWPFCWINIWTLVFLPS